MAATDLVDTPRFSHLLNTVLGSPFLTTSDALDLPPDVDFVDGTLSAVPRSFTVTRPSSPTLSHIIDTFSIISPSEVPDDVFFSSNHPYPHTPAKLSLLTRSISSSVAHVLNSPTAVGGTPAALASSERCTSPRQLKSFIPRLLDALSSPGRNAFPRSQRLSPNAKGKARATDLDFSNVNYQDLDPLDGEEGELIEDEACFIDITVVTGMDILSLLPVELSLYIMSNFLDLSSVLACLAVSRKWRAIASDNSVWRGLFVAEGSRYDGRGWAINLRRIRGISTRARYAGFRGSKLDGSMHRWNRKYGNGHNVGTSSPGSGSRRSLKLKGGASPFRHSHSITQAPLLDWCTLYQERLELDRRWTGGEPDVRKLEGHTDSVYCLEFDSTRIITGSRDRTIKVWSLATGRLLGTFYGHSGSVLCLKFDKDWEVDDGRSNQMDDGDPSTINSRTKSSRRRKRPGFMVSGSSDCTVHVWDMYTEHFHQGRRYVGTAEDDGDDEGYVWAHTRLILRGHTGGVLDIKMDEKWIVSCSKDTLIRVWDRRTLQLHRTLWGHEGPVNAVGLQSDYTDRSAPCHGGRVVSASGDGKMMMWDIESGQRLRTFEGHDRGLACIEFKGDLIVSGSSDLKIKVWSAWTGECLRTLVGHDALVRALSFEPKSGRLVSASYDKTVKVWDLKTGQLVREFRNTHTGFIFDVKFDVGRIVSTSHDKNVVVLDFTKGIDSTLYM